VAVVEVQAELSYLVSPLANEPFERLGRGAGFDRGAAGNVHWRQVILNLRVRPTPPCQRAVRLLVDGERPLGGDLIAIDCDDGDRSNNGEADLSSSAGAVLPPGRCYQLLDMQVHQVDPERVVVKLVPADNRHVGRVHDQATRTGGPELCGPRLRIPRVRGGDFAAVALAVRPYPSAVNHGRFHYRSPTALAGRPANDENPVGVRGALPPAAARGWRPTGGWGNLCGRRAGDVGRSWC